jgi:PKD repeat protein
MIVAWDSHNASASSTTWDAWNFTTKSYSPGGGGGSGGSSEEPENTKPVAKVSPDGSYSGVVNVEILFDGSTSNDSDGNITQWSWNFGDNSTGTGATISHAYTNAGNYTVTLTVTDDKDATDSDSTTCVITQPNRQPTPPVISGPTNGTRNTLYTYTVRSTDSDNDSIRYTFDWGDALSGPESSGFLPSGANFSLNHSWETAGRYTITVSVTDTKTTPLPSSDYTVFIDAKQITGLGYLLDNNSDGTYDAFYSDASKQITSVEKKDGNYLIDSNGNGVSDLSYDELTGNTSSIKEDNGIPGFELLPLISALIIIIALRRRKKEK